MDFNPENILITQSEFFLLFYCQRNEPIYGTQIHNTSVQGAYFPKFLFNNGRIVTSEMKKRRIFQAYIDLSLKKLILGYSINRKIAVHSDSMMSKVKNQQISVS